MVLVLETPLSPVKDLKVVIEADSRLDGATLC